MPDASVSSLQAWTVGPPGISSARPAVACFEEQGSLGAEIQGLPLEHLPEPADAHPLTQGAVERPPVVEYGPEVLYPTQLEVQVRENGVEERQKVHVASELGA